MSGTDVTVDPIEVLANNEEVVISQQSEIEKAFSNTLRTERVVDSDERVNNAVMIAISPEADIETASVLSASLINFLGRSTAQLITDLRDRGVSKDLLQFMNNLSIEYREDLRDKKFADLQGENWWSFVDTDVVHRSEAIGFEHHITIARRRRIRFDSDISGGMLLASHFADEVASVINAHEQEAIDQINPAAIDTTIENLQQLAEKLNQLSNEEEIEEDET